MRQREHRCSMSCSTYLQVLAAAATLCWTSSPAARLKGAGSQGPCYWGMDWLLISQLWGSATPWQIARTPGTLLAFKAQAGQRGAFASWQGCTLAVAYKRGPILPGGRILLQDAMSCIPAAVSLF